MSLIGTDATWSGELADTLPSDGFAGTLIGRVWDPSADGPSPVLVRSDGVYDLGESFPTVGDLCEADGPAEAAVEAAGDRLGDAAAIVANANPDARDRSRPWLLSPVDTQALKAAGVTFAVSMLERVIEERVRGDLEAAARMRQSILEEIGTDLRTIRPGSAQAAALKAFLIEGGLWSQYLEVGIGPDAEIFTKGLALSAVGTFAEVGVLSESQWNNPEPEVVLAVNSRGSIVGATLGNDVNLRDIEGRSALLLPKAKDNNASCALGPFLRLFDSSFSLDTVRHMRVTLDVVGRDGFRLQAASEMSQISRDPADLVAQLIGAQHQYPDGAMLMLGTMFAPVVDRDAPDQGFTHHMGDLVRISSPELGSLSNRVQTCEDCEPWEFGMRALMRNLARRQRI